MKMMCFPVNFVSPYQPPLIFLSSGSFVYTHMRAPRLELIPYSAHRPIILSHTVSRELVVGSTNLERNDVISNQDFFSCR